MDYDENDFQNHNLHLAGEGSNKFPPVLLPYALPKFDFDDGLNGSLRFDSLVETEVFLGIESNVDNQWIEDFSRGTSGIQFSSSAAESCSLSRHNNVWSEATSSESVEMLLKSVGQEDNTPVQTNTKGSDACDELGCILKHMDPILKQDSDTSPKVEDTANLQAKFLPGEDVEDFSVLDNDVGQQQPLDDSSQDHKGEASADSGLVPLVDLSAISVEVRQPVIEGSLSNDSNSNHVTQREVDNVENGPSNDMPQKGPGSGMQDGATLHNITTGNMELTEKDGPDDIDNTCDAHKDFLETNTGENQKKGHVLSQEGQMEDENPCSDAMESVEEANIIETNLSNFGEPLCIIPKGHSGFPEDLVTSGQSEVDIVGGSMMAIEDNICFERHEIEDSNGSHLDNKSLSNKCEASILSSESCEPAKVKVGGTSNSNTGGVSCLVAVCCSAEVVGEEARVPSPFLAESSQICGKSMAPAEGKDTIELPSGNVSTENNFIASRLQFNAASDSKSAPDVSCKLANIVTCDIMDGVPTPSGDITNADADIGHKDVKMSHSSEIGFSPLDKEKETTDKISAEASLSGLETSCQLIAGLDPGPESKKGASSGAAGQLVCESAEQSPLMVDACKTEGSEVIDKVSLESTKEMDVCPVLCDSTANKGDDAEVLVKVNDEKESSISFSRESTKEMDVCPVLCDSTANKGDDAEVLVKVNDEKESSKVSEPTVNENQMLGPISSEKEDFREDTNQKGQEENEAAIASEDNSDKKIDVPSTQEENEAAIASEDNSDKKIDFPITSDCGSCADIGKAASGSPTVIRAAGDFQSESDKEGAKCSVEQTAVADSNASKALSGSRDPKQNDASKDERSFTFEILNASPSSGLVQIDPKLAQDVPCGSPKVSDVAIARSGSKGTSERKTRRPSAKAMGKESARKGNPIKDTASVRLEKGAKTNNVSPSPSGILQHVQSNEMQRYGHVDSSTMKPFVNASSTSSLPDLNSSASPSVMFQQPFTDLQQVQLRAQIFVYGALIMPRGPIMDHHRAFSPMHTHQTSQIRNFAGNSWISQAPFCGPWATSPQTPVLDTSCHFSAQLPITEPVQLTPVKDLSMPIISGANHVSPGPAIQIGASASVFTGTFPVPDAKKVAAPSSQPRTDPKPRKRKKTPFSESPGQNILHPHPQTESVPALVVTSHPSTSAAITTPVIYVSKPLTEKFVASVSPTPTDIIKGNQNAEQRNMLSEETLDKHLYPYLQY
ncbi:WISKOTT-ALDRICH SYNDROME PROTEIN [Salix suchowensis]|nr:WISKOTT-ALDRICH SYNDROME PROTEIN [Salix suchowensis]